MGNFKLGFLFWNFDLANARLLALSPQSGEYRGQEINLSLEPDICGDFAVKALLSIHVSWKWWVWQDLSLQSDYRLTPILGGSLKWKKYVRLTVSEWRGLSKVLLLSFHRKNRAVLMSRAQNFPWKFHQSTHFSSFWAIGQSLINWSFLLGQWSFTKCLEPFLNLWLSIWFLLRGYGQGYYWTFTGNSGLWSLLEPGISLEFSVKAPSFLA